MLLRWLPPEFGSPGRVVRVYLVASTRLSRRGARELAEQLFGRAVRVQVGGVDEVAAPVDVGVEDATSLVLLRTPAPVGAERHGPQSPTATPAGRSGPAAGRYRAKPQTSPSDVPFACPASPPGSPSPPGSGTGAAGVREGASWDWHSQGANVGSAHGRQGRRSPRTRGVPADSARTPHARRRRPARAAAHAPHPRSAPGGGRRAGRRQRRLRHPAGAGPRPAPLPGRARRARPGAAAQRRRARVPVRPGPALVGGQTAAERRVRARSPGWCGRCHRCPPCWSTIGSTSSPGIPRWPS